MKKVLILLIVIFEINISACINEPAERFSQSETATSAQSENEMSEDGLSQSIYDKTSEDKSAQSLHDESSEEPVAHETLYGEIKELNELYEYADRIGENNSIGLFIADLVPDEILEDADNERQNDPTIIKSALDAINRILTDFEGNLGFFKNFTFANYKRLEIYVVGYSPVGNGYFSTRFTDNGNEEVLFIVLDAEDENMVDALYYTLPHEITHACDFRLTYLAENETGHIFSEEEWASYNPEGFQYTDYNNELELEMFDKYYDYFAFSYGCQNSSEDRATLMGQLMDAYFNGRAYNTTEQCIVKLKYYFACLRDGMDWKDQSLKTTWEIALDTAENALQSGNY